MKSAKIKLELDPQLGIPRPNDLKPHAWSNPVVPGDHPDPTIIRVGGTYWASATSGEWSPQFPLFRSQDLMSWDAAGAIFPEQPGWAEGSFWAPELVHDEVSGKFLVWYVGRKRGGPLCIAVATADAPEGPYQDRGPLICEELGSIDPCFARDEHGAPYLIWKTDGNSKDEPTPIWAQALTDDLLYLVGERTQLITNDQPWEAGVVEGPYVMRHRDSDGVMRFYLFYAGNSCCGRECKYAEGVARSEKLLGPWEKFAGNPLIDANANWRCPGHGTAVHTEDAEGKPGQDYLLYHAYPAGGTIYVGREAVLDEITWGDAAADGTPGWPNVNEGAGPGEAVEPQPIDFKDDFAGDKLCAAWQWPVNTRPQVRVASNGVLLTVPMDSPMSPRPVESAMIAVPRPASLHYRACVRLAVPDAPDWRLWSGLAVVGDPFNTIGLGLRGTDMVLWERRGDRQHVVAQVAAPQAKSLMLRATSFGPEHFLRFSFYADGEAWQAIGGDYDASDLPVWDRGLRLGLMLEGPHGCSAAFSAFELLADSDTSGFRDDA